MKKILLALALLPLTSLAQVTFQPFVSFGYLKEAPTVNNSRTTRDYEGHTSYDGAPRLVYLSDISNVQATGLYFGGGCNIGLKKLPLSLQFEVTGEHFILNYRTESKERRRTEYDFEYYNYDHHLPLTYVRFTPSIVYKTTTKSNITIQAQGGVSMMVVNDGPSSFMYGVSTEPYAAINGGVAIGYSGLMLDLQANFGTANLFTQQQGFNVYSKRFTAGIRIYPKQFREMFL
jgi:hypothetical protein